MGGVFNKYFQDLFSSSSPQFLQELDDLFVEKLGVTENAMLCAIPTCEEIIKVVWQMHPLKAPRPNEVLSKLLIKEEQLGSVHGIRICKDALPSSHLMFVDDTILFARANEAEAQPQHPRGTEVKVETIISSTSRKFSNFLSTGNPSMDSKQIALPISVPPAPIHQVENHVLFVDASWKDGTAGFSVVWANYSLQKWSILVDHSPTASAMEGEGDHFGSAVG
uniref:Uncharacterized protein n=1 Tax=Cannabis sativa TaxID=3483 RepID=A0A803PAB0_CANSA